MENITQKINFESIFGDSNRIKVLKVLLNEPSGFDLKFIAKECNINVNRIVEELTRLEDIGLVERDFEMDVSFYSLSNDILARCLLSSYNIVEAVLETKEIEQLDGIANKVYITGIESDVNSLKAQIKEYESSIVNCKKCNGKINKHSRLCCLCGVSQE